ncbi:hypothetical protein EXU57_17745 [Segetibacter sp. 3557_3]|uniref:2-oxo acid dehydrogenase subunit E2 n=1 Tax=Segetibacter sp. 3557_3 TaxID=2547429 RepID=UPI0010584B2A|nr:2-oxo acid dehydrogenase subunit E2 [Segetibacter sp. 3557_3]TDH23316.1 hypothetical protein EXU57_17745 [Segetibacter sp. 3557_3]
MALLQQIKVPLLSVNDTTLTVVEVLFKTGEAVSKGSLVLVFETSKTTYEVIAEADGYIDYQCKAGEDYEVNRVVANIYSDLAEIEVAVKSKLNGTKVHVDQASYQTVSWNGDTMFSNKALDLIKQHGFDKGVFADYDFVSSTDVETKFGLASPVTAMPVQPPATKKMAGQGSVPANVTMQKLSSTKKREIEFLSAVQSSGLTSTLHITVETAGIFSNINNSLKYLKNSLLPIILYESARLLKKHPLLNAFLNNDQIGLYDRVNTGFAIDAGKGLKVLKVEDTNQKTINRIEEEIMQLSERYLQDQLAIEDLSDITFTVTDLSSEGVTAFQPLVNMNNSAILGVSAVDEKLGRCNLSITFDHRVTEGKLGAIFLRELKERLESYGLENGAIDTSGIACFRCYKTLAEDLSGIGFAKCVTSAGKEAYVCQSCLKGF